LALGFLILCRLGVGSAIIEASKEVRVTFKNCA